MVIVLSQYFYTLSPKYGRQYSQGVSHSSLMMMNCRIMRLIVQMCLQVESRTRSSAQSNPPTTTSPSFLQHLDLQVSSYLSGWSLSRLNERRSQLAESKWDSFNSESFKSLSVVATQKTPKIHWTKETTTGALVWVPCLREWGCMYLWKWCRCVQENICEVEKSTVVVTVNGWYLQYSTWTVAF